MYKAVIIDDEPIIVTGLTRLVPWEKYQCSVVGTAADGEQGLSLIRQEQPDLIFTDIYMPKMDGLLMIAALRSEFEDMEISILTGYRDFELVQKALHLGVSRFLLKPSRLPELEEALKTMTEKLGKKGIAPDHEIHKTQRAEAEKVDDDSLPARNFLVNKALQYMDDHYQKKIALTDVAEAIYVSQWHLSKILNQVTGKSFSELLSEIRIEKAKMLLRDPAYRIGDAAEAVGFTDITHFSKVFKKVTGMNANTYRNQFLS